MPSTTDSRRPLPRLGQGYRRDRPPRPKPAAVAWHVPAPSIVLLGCQPFRRAVPRYHGGRRGKFIDERPEAPCPTCGGSVRDRPDACGKERPSVVYCGRCDEMDPAHAPALANQRTDERVRDTSRDDAERSARTLGHLADAVNRDGIQLSESERRRIWAGNRKSLLTTLPGVALTALAASGREFLRSIGQEPDFDVILDRRGQAVDRWSRLHDLAVDRAERLLAMNPTNARPEAG